MPVMFGMELGCLGGVVRRVVQMTLGRVRVVRRGLVVFALVVCGSLAMVTGRMFVVFRCFAMMLCRFLGHIFSSGFWSCGAERDATGLMLLARDAQMNSSGGCSNPPGTIVS